MRHPRRQFMMVCLTILIGLLGSLTAASLWLTVWVPTNGKIWLEEQLRRQLPLDMSIGNMKYSPWQGLLLEDVSAVDRDDPSTTWFHASQLRARISFLTLLVRQQVAFRLEGPFTAPCETDLVMSGAFGFRSRQLEMDLLTSEIALNQISPPLAQHLPPTLKAGTIRLRFRVKWRPGMEPVITGRILGTHLLWEQGTIRFMSQMSLDGTVMPPAHGLGQHRWRVDLSATIEQGQLEGLPVLGSASEVSGTIRFANDTVEIETLRGTTLGSPWQMEGVIHTLAEPDLDLLIRTRVDLAMVATQLVANTQPWQPKGVLELVTVCRGPLARWPDLEIMAHALVQEASFTIPAHAERLDHLAGNLQYDHLTKHLTIESLAGRLRGAPVTLRGAVQLVNPVVFNLTAETMGEVPLAPLNELLPHDSPIHALAGSGSVRVDLHGPTTQLTWQGTATVTDAKLSLRGLTKPIEGVRGTIHFTDQELSGQQLTFVIDNQPVTLTATVTNLSTSPHLAGQAQLAEGSIVFTGTLHPDRIVLDVGELSIGSSRVSVHGHVSRVSRQASQLAATGSITLADLDRLPWFHPKPLAAWQLDGDVTIHVQLLGSFDDWRTGSAAGFVHADAMSIRGIPVRDLSIELEQGQQRLAVRVTNARVADGRLAGEFIMEEQPDAPRSLLEVDVTMVDLAQLAPAIPTWRERHIQGTASGHVSLMRLGKDRTGLRGQGWLQAKGEHLGDLPLLDRLFRGMFGALADRLGLSTLRKTQVTELGGQWRLFNERILTDDLQLSGVSGSEPITISVQGSVGLDQTLDLVIEPDLSEQLMLQAPQISTLSSTVLKVVGGVERLRRLVGRHHVTGTIDKPAYKFEVSLDQILNQLLPSRIDQLLDSIR